MRLISSTSPTRRRRPTSPAEQAGISRIGAEGETVGVAKARGDHTALVYTCRPSERVVGESIARERIDTNHGAVEKAGLTSRPPQALTAQRATLGRRRKEGGAETAGRIAAGVLLRRTPTRAAELAVVDAGVSGSFTAACVQRAVGAKVEIADRVSLELLAPLVVDQRLGERDGQRRAGDRQTDEPRPHSASIDVATWGIRAAVTPGRALHHS